MSQIRVPRFFIKDEILAKTVLPMSSRQNTTHNVAKFQ